MAELPPELGPQLPQQQEGQSPGIRESLGKLSTGDPVEAFLIEILSVTEEIGMNLDEVFGPNTVEDDASAETELSEGFEHLSEEQLARMSSLYNAIPEPQKSEMTEKILAELSPELGRRFLAVVRFDPQGGRVEG